jgi:DNA-directed RNA polymerase subunit RPC12/RpoP
MGRTVDMFQHLKPPRVKRMHCDDSGQGMAHFVCSRCGAESEWIQMENFSEIKRGIPCQNCNKENDNATH